jgi:hypothetical protein
MSYVFPSTIERWCCPGKSCGNTELKLVVEPSVDGTINYYEYVRVSNGDSYSGVLMSETQMIRWLEETKDHIQEEMDKDLVEVERETKIKILNDELFDQMDLPRNLMDTAYPIETFDPKKEFDVWEIHSEYSRIPVGKINLTFSDGGVEVNVTERDYVRENSVGKFTDDDIHVISDSEQSEYFLAQAEVARSEARQEFKNQAEVAQNATDDDIPEEFLEKQQKLAEFLLELATGMWWNDPEAVELQGNYTADADDILRSNPHLLGLGTRNAMKLDEDSRNEELYKGAIDAIRSHSRGEEQYRGAMRSRSRKEDY